MTPKQILIADLKDCVVPNDKKALFDAMLECALCGDYGDFTSQFDAPIHKLVEDANKVGLTNIAKNAIDGKYDG